MADYEAVTTIEKQNAQGSMSDWELKPPFKAWHLLVLLLVLGIMMVSAKRVRLDQLGSQLFELVEANVGLKESSQVGRGISRVIDNMFPLVVSQKTDINRIENFDENNLPWFSRLEVLEHTEHELNDETLLMEETTTKKTYLVEDYGYLFYVLVKMVETIEIAIWATILAIMVSAPLAYLAAKNYTPHRVLYVLSRGGISFLRAIPELISALFLVLAFSFGPVAGILALGLHSAGFLGKFYAEDIEDADEKPQEALRAIGTSKLRTLRLAVLPQVLPSYTGLTLYVLDRNVRMATVVGLVGGGGIGQELKGQYDLFQYDHVGTILLIIFITVFALDQISARIRGHLI